MVIESAVADDDGEKKFHFHQNLGTKLANCFDIPNYIAANQESPATLFFWVSWMFTVCLIWTCGGIYSYFLLESSRLCFVLLLLIAIAFWLVGLYFFLLLLRE